MLEYGLHFFSLVTLAATLSKTFEITEGGGFENHFFTFIFISEWTPGRMLTRQQRY
jgi:hypothetical protein